MARAACAWAGSLPWREPQYTHSVKRFVMSRASSSAEAMPECGHPDAHAQQQRQQHCGTGQVLGALGQVVQFVADAVDGGLEIGRAVQQECRDRSRMPSSA
eukprot:TRINITY_DN23951_c0_g1_i2.p1 TRINITY_DN23951_c0_g1~~TRINITY_DN23951_c0_g1_i2.p1  ORF type:complete len:101 (+),score=14.93 TRINITY_DN23951_c0_g1_i2:3-305(+)